MTGGAPAGFESAFGAAEHAERLARFRAFIERKGIDVAVIADPANMHWLTGYDGWSFYVPQAVVVPVDGPALWWGRGMDAAGARRTIPTGVAEIMGYDDGHVHNTGSPATVDLARRLRGLGLGAAIVGVELDAHYWTARLQEVLAREMPSAIFRDVTGAVNRLRAVKSPAEVALMRKAARLVERMHAVIRNVARPGVPKHEVIAAAVAEGIRGADGVWGDYPAIVPMAPSGPDAAAPHLTWNDAPIPSGAPTFFEIAGVCRRYHCPQSRTLCFGAVPARYRKAEAAAHAAIEAGLSAARPGATAAEVAAAVLAAIRAHGFEKDSRVGYGVG
ncbi:MAG: M24 family metallopeptidase, partial [Alphaproteobacteria bacterium]